MLNFSFTSVIMAIVTSNLFIIVLTIIFLDHKLMYKIGLPMLGILCILVFTRMLFPFGFTGITTNINFPQRISKIMSFIYYPFITVYGYSFSLWHLFIVIWGIVFLVLLLKYILLVRKMYHFICEYGTDITDCPVYASVLERMELKKKIQDKITVQKLPLIQSPAVFRYHLHYYILMPDRLVLDEKEKEFIFRHEVSHILHHDITLKFLLQMVCLFYWWNPFCIILKKESDLIFELRIDSSVTNGEYKEIEQYLSCLVKVSKQNMAIKDKVQIPSAISFSLKFKSDTAIRARFLLKEQRIKNKIITLLASLPLFIIFILSFMFVFEGYYISPEYAEEGKEVTSSNTYAIKGENNTYDIYFDGMLIDTVSSLEYYPEDCKIYLSLEEALKNEEK